MYGHICTGQSPEHKTPAQMDSPEYKTLVQCYPTLVSCVQQSPNDISLNLIPSGILTQHDIEYLRDRSISIDKKARRLLNIVLNRVQIDPQVYHTFIAALENAGSWTRKAVADLEQTYVSLIQSPVADVPSTEEPGESFVFEFLILEHIIFVRFQPPHTVCVILIYLHGSFCCKFNFHCN